MALVLTFTDATGGTDYGLIIDQAGLFWNTALVTFEAYNAAHYTDYDVAAVEQGASGVYEMTWPAAVSGAGVYNVIYKRRAGGAPAAGDAIVGTALRVGVAGQVTTPAVSPSTPGMVTGYLTTYDENGAPEAAVNVHLQVKELASINDDTVALQFGYALDSTARTEVSDGAGLVEFTNLIRGVSYNLWRGTSNRQFVVTVPADATDPYALPSIIGEP